MMRIDIPYGQGSVAMHVEQERLAGVLRPAGLRAAEDEDEAVLRAMAEPQGSPALGELARGRDNAVIIISDHTRPVPSRRIVPHMLRELRLGNPAIDITLLVATGCHRGTTPGELCAKLGEDIVKNERIIVHDCDDEDNLVTAGVLPSGAPLRINRIAMQTQLLLAEGFIEPHFFAGFSGGRKSVLPGVCARETVLGNHCAAFIDDPASRAGTLDGNPIHRDMLAAADMARLEYIVNVVLDGDKRIAAAFAGAHRPAHGAGCAYLQARCRVKAAPADIVVTSNGGAPLDQNLYQCVKGISTAEASAKEDGVIIMCGQCADGVGGEDFFQAMARCADARELMGRILSVPMDKTPPDQWQYQILCRALLRHRVIFVTGEELAGTVRAMKMHYAPDIASALAMARAWKGGGASVAVIPDGVSVIVEGA